MSLWLDLTKADGRIGESYRTLEVIAHRMEVFGVSVEGEANVRAAMHLLKAARQHVQEAARLIPEAGAVVIDSPVPNAVHAAFAKLATSKRTAAE